MKVTIEIDITDCRDCLFRRSYRGHGECWEECIHEDNGQDVYEDILWGCGSQFESVPDWCPLGLGVL